MSCGAGHHSARPGPVLPPGGGLPGEEGGRLQAAAADTGLHATSHAAALPKAAPLALLISHADVHSYGCLPLVTPSTWPHVIEVGPQRSMQASRAPARGSFCLSWSVTVSSRWGTLRVRPVAVQSDKGTPSDKLRAALVYLLTCESLPSDSEYEQITTTLQVTCPSPSHTYSWWKGEYCVFNYSQYAPVTYVTSLSPMPAWCSTVPMLPCTCSKVCACI